MVVVFDIGNVLLRWNPRNLFRKVFADEDAMETFLATACAMDWIIETDRARSFQAALDARIAAYPQYAGEQRLFNERWIETLGRPIHENVALLSRLRNQGDKLYSITNFCDEKFEIARGRYPFLDWFDGIIVSSCEGLVKPDPRIFELFLTRFDLPAQKVLFVDDSERNVVAARAVGMQAIYFVDGVALLNEPRLVDDQHAVRVSKPLHDVVANLVAKPIGVPLTAAEQRLNAIGPLGSRLFRHQPAGLPFDARQKPVEKCAACLLQLTPTQHRPDASLERCEFLLPRQQ